MCASVSNISWLLTKKTQPIQITFISPLKMKLDIGLAKISHSQDHTIQQPRYPLRPAELLSSDLIITSCLEWLLIKTKKEFVSPLGSLPGSNFDLVCHEPNSSFGAGVAFYKTQYNVVAGSTLVGQARVVL